MTQVNNLKTETPKKYIHDELIYKVIPVDLVQRDPEQPRTKDRIEHYHKDLLTSIKDTGMRQPIAVKEIRDGKYQIIDGHRRYECAKKLGFASVPCLVNPKADEGEQEKVRYFIQSQIMSWKPTERAEVLARISIKKNFKINEQLAEYMHISKSQVDRSLDLRNQNVNFIEFLKGNKLDQAYIDELVKLRSKLIKIKKIEVDDINEILVKKIKSKVIRNAKDLRKLKKVFLRSAANEEEINKFLINPKYRIAELAEKAITDERFFMIDKLLKKIAEDIQNSLGMSPQELDSFKKLVDLYPEMEKLSQKK